MPNFVIHKLEKVPTPQARDSRSGEGHRWINQKERSRNLNDAVAFMGGYKMTPEAEPQKGGGQLNPTYVCWLMGLPLGFDALPLMNRNALRESMPLAMDAFLSRQRSLLASLLDGLDSEGC